MKLLKILLPKILIIGIPIVIQIFIFVVTYIWLSESFAWINLFISLIGVLIFLRIINKDNPASFKLSWSVLILIIPINIILHAATGISYLSASLPVVGAIVLILISVGLTMIAGLIPSRLAAKKDPVIALRTE